MEDSQSLMPRSGSSRQCLTWTKVAPGATGVVPPPRSGAASVVVKGKLYVFGGYGGGTGRLDDFFEFSFETGEWEPVKVLSREMPGCRENNGVVISDSKNSIYLFGGYNGNCWLNDLWKFDIESHQWTCIQPSSDPEHADESNVAMGDRTFHTDQQVFGQAPSRRFGYVSVVHEGKFVLFGGFDGSKWLNDMYEFDFSTSTWTEIQARGSLPSVRSCPAWAKDSTHVYIQGGYDGIDRKSDFFACDLATYTWTQLPCLGTPPSPRYFHSCCLYANKMYCYGGYSGNERLADMYTYDFETNHWAQVDCSSGDSPSGRSSLVAQVYENCLYIFGGYNGTNVLNDFYRFRLNPILMPPPGLVRDLSRMVDNSELADVQFLVEDKIVYAHRSILAFRAEYFKVMLCGGMRESLPEAQTPADQSAPITLPHVSHKVFLKVLEFIYTDTVKELSLDTGIQLLIASEQFLLDRLKALCEDSIRRDVTCESVINILSAAHQHNAVGLKDIALEFMLQRMNDPSIMSGLADLKSQPELLLEIIKRTNTSSIESDRSRDNNSRGGGNDDGSPFGGGSEWNTRR